MERTNRYLGDRVVALRKKMGITQAELAESSNLSIRTVQRIELNAVEPYDDTLKKIATTLSVELSELKDPHIPLKKVMLVHLSPLTGFFIPLFQIFAPFVLWLFYRGDCRHIDRHIKDIIAFHLATTILFVFGLILVYFGFSAGYILSAATIVTCTFITLWNAYRLSENKQYLYFNAFGLKGLD